MKNNHLHSTLVSPFWQFRLGSAYLQAECPSFPSIPSRMPEAIREPKALLIRLPQERTAVRTPSSDRLYHFDNRNKAPGKNAASTNPRKKRVSSAPVKLNLVRMDLNRVFVRGTHLVVIPVSVEIIPQTTMHTGRYMDGFPM